MSAAKLTWGNAWRIAKRDLNARFRGLRLLLVCLFLGTAALAAIGTLTSAIERELESNGQVLLGGDLEVEIWQRRLNQEELAKFAEYGRVTGGTRLQAIATSESGTSPIGLKAVDTAWPLYGAMTLVDGSDVGAPTGNDAWLAQGALDRLGIAVGDRFTLGSLELKAAGVIGNEPDKLSEGFQLGATVIVAEDVPERAGLLQPGSLYESKYRIAFDDQGRNPESVEDELTEAFPTAGYDFRTRDRASPGADRFVRQMSDFLTLVGLAALIIAGIGIAGGVSSYLEARRGSIATFKVLGASSSDIVRIYALQIGVAALIGSAAGIAVGVLVTPLLGAALQGLLPVESGFVIEPAPLILAAAYGLLVAFAFAATPLLRARKFPAMALMRSTVSPLGRDRGALIWTGLGIAAICVLAVATTAQPQLSAGFLVGAGGALILLAGLGFAIQKLARRIPRPSNPLWRSALSNLHRPGAPTGSLVTALGFGLAAFVLLAAVQSALDGNIERSVPAEAPDYFVLDVPVEGEDKFRSLVDDRFPGSMIRAVPTLRGSVIAFGAEGAMQRVADLEEIPPGAWALRGERGITYSDDLPEGNRLIEGEWWNAGPSNEPQVSIDAEFARAADLQIGDQLTIGILGVERTATIANLREIEWENMGFNFTMVFSRSAISDAPHNLAATVDLPEIAAGSEAARERGEWLREMVSEFPASSVIEVGEVLTQARTILEQVGLATLAAAGVTVLAGLAVLMGAIAAARASRTYDTVVLRVLGASRKQVLLVQLAEYGLIAALLAAVALALGSTLAWVVITQLFEFDWLPDWGEVLAVLGLGLAMVLAFAIGGSLPLLRAKPAQALREL
ncbi:MAG: FtsX-like permease family protein [Erythrobacter sp.]